VWEKNASAFLLLSGCFTFSSEDTHTHTHLIYNRDDECDDECAEVCPTPDLDLSFPQNKTHTAQQILAMPGLPALLGLPLLVLLLLPSVPAFVLPLPPLSSSPVTTTVMMMAAGSVRADPLRKGDRVVVIGSSGGCGRLIRCVRIRLGLRMEELLTTFKPSHPPIDRSDRSDPIDQPHLSRSTPTQHPPHTTSARLAADGKYKVRAVARSEGKLRDVLGLDDSPQFEYAQADSRDPDSLLGPLSDADAVVIATGTSAFPSPRWKGGNTPDAVDRKGVRNILEALASKPRRRPVKKVGGVFGGG
jgi:hypothetical protein